MPSLCTAARLSPPKLVPALLASALLALALLSSGCATGGSTVAVSGRLSVVAAENFWGSLAAQLGGSRVSVQSIIVNPNTDPHSYEPTASDAIALARSQMAIVNGIGYDNWASKQLQASPDATRSVLDVGGLLGLAQGANPHQWYSPAAVGRVIAQIADDYKRLDPRDGAYFDQRRSLLLNQGLAAYGRLRQAVRVRFAGVPVGYSESIFQPLGEDLGLRLVTPYSFARAIAEGTDVSARDKQAVDAQVQRRQVKVWVFNRQNVTPDVQRVNQLAQSAHIPVVAITETLDPATATFEQWQDGQLARLVAALHAATGH